MKRKTLVIAVLLCLSSAFFGAHCYAQSEKVKKSKNFSNSTLEQRGYYDKSSGKLKKHASINDLLSSARRLQSKSPDKAIQFVEQALVQALDQKDDKRLGDCYELLGAINLSIEEWHLAAENYRKAIDYYDSGNNTSAKDKCILNLSRSLLKLSNNQEVIELTASLKKSSKNRSIVKESMKLLADAYFNTKKYDQSLEEYKQVLMLEREAKNQPGIIEANASISRVYAAKEEAEKAEYYFNQSQNTLNEYNVQRATRKRDLFDSEALEKNEKAQEELSTLYEKDENIEKALELRKRSLKDNAGFGNKKEEYHEQVKIGDIYLERGDVDSAIQILEHTIADSKLESAKGLKSDKEIAEANKLLSNAYEQVNDYQQALKFYKAHLLHQEQLYKDSLKRERKTRLAIKKQNELTSVEGDIRIYERDLQLSSAEIKTQKLLNSGLILLLVVISIAGFFIYRNARARRVANQLLALKSLRSQMNPHFIFNALNSVNNFISTNDERQANKFLADFSKLMRMVLENSQKDFVPISNEIELIELYLKLEHYRFRDKFSYTFTVDEHIDRESIDVPPMLIQPYIENAVWHGLRYKEEQGQLNVTIKKLADSIEVVIEDNGIGRKKSQELKTKNQRKTKSTGIINTANRLNLLNKVYKVNYHVDIVDLQEPKEGTIVHLLLPNIINNEA